MLTTIKQCIEEAKTDNTTFEELFVEYVMYVEDVNIGNELDYILRHNILDINVINHMVDLAVGGLNLDK